MHLASRHDFEESLMEEEFLASTGHESMTCVCVGGGVYLTFIECFSWSNYFLIEV